jgi:anti-sigma factor ChrR (cupin superfamily)
MKKSTVLDQAILASLLDAAAPVQPPASLKNKVMLRAGISMPANKPLTISDKQGWLTLTPLLDIKLLFVDEGADSVSYLLKAKPGAAVAAHEHSGYEECLVLEGDVWIGDDVQLGPGDFHCAGPNQSHPVLSTRGGTLVYLRAPIKDCPIPL